MIGVCVSFVNFFFFIWLFYWTRFQSKWSSMNMNVYIDIMLLFNRLLKELGTLCDWIGNSDSVPNKMYTWKFLLWLNGLLKDPYATRKQLVLYGLVWLLYVEFINLGFFLQYSVHSVHYNTLGPVRWKGVCLELEMRSVWFHMCRWIPSRLLC